MDVLPIYSNDEIADYLTAGYWGGSTRALNLLPNNTIYADFNGFSGTNFWGETDDRGNLPRATGRQCKAFRYGPDRLSPPCRSRCRLPRDHGVRPSRARSPDSTFNLIVVFGPFRIRIAGTADVDDLDFFQRAKRLSRFGNVGLQPVR